MYCLCERWIAICRGVHSVKPGPVSPWSSQQAAYLCCLYQKVSCSLTLLMPILDFNMTLWHAVHGRHQRWETSPSYRIEILALKNRIYAAQQRIFHRTKIHPLGKLSQKIQTSWRWRKRERERDPNHWYIGFMADVSTFNWVSNQLPGTNL